MVFLKFQIKWKKYDSILSYILHTKWLYWTYILKLIIQTKTSLGLLKITNSLLHAFMKNPIEFFNYRILIMNIFVLLIIRSAELGDTQDFDDEDMSLFSTRNEPSQNMKSLVRVIHKKDDIRNKYIIKREIP